MPTHRWAVAADTNQPLPSGVAGEVFVRGPNVTPGSWDDPEAARAVFDAEDWFHPGDVG